MKMVERCFLGHTKSSVSDGRTCSVANTSTRYVSVQFVLFLVAAYGVSAAAAGVCSGCYNGGQLFLPNNIFGPCRCLCSSGFVGPQCEFVGKRSGGDATAISPDADLLEDSRLESRLNLLKDIWWRVKDKLNADSQMNDNIDANDRKIGNDNDESHDHTMPHKYKSGFGTVEDWLE